MLLVIPLPAKKSRLIFTSGTAGIWSDSKVWYTILRPWEIQEITRAKKKYFMQKNFLLRYERNYFWMLYCQVFKWVVFFEKGPKCLHPLGVSRKFEIAPYTNDLYLKETVYTLKADFVCRWRAPLVMFKEPFRCSSFTIYWWTIWHYFSFI